ncbi:MAG: hypothetical protein AAF589_05375, partial [Planctomycetota bacterium]
SLLTRGWTVPQAAMFITLICATTCLAAVLAVLWKSELIALGIVAAVVAFLIYTKTFGHIEFSLMSSRFRESAASLATSRTGMAVPKQRAVQLQGSREWDRLWAAMTEAADDYRLVKMKLSISIPQLHEVFYGSWESATKPEVEADELWSVIHPLIVDGQKVGHVELKGLPDPNRASTPAHMIQVLEFLEPIEDDVRYIREQISADQQHQDDETATRPSLIGIKAYDPSQAFDTERVDPPSGQAPPPSDAGSAAPASPTNPEAQQASPLAN